MARKQALPGIRLSGDALKTALDQGAQQLPSISPSDSPAPPVPTRQVRSLSLPTYVWKWLKAVSKERDEPQNVIVLKALRSAGCPIPDKDLIDGRLRK